MEGDTCVNKTAMLVLSEETENLYMVTFQLLSMNGIYKWHNFV